MNEISTIEGRWWIHGPDANPEAGILTVDGDELILKVNTATSMTVSDIVRTALAQQNIQYPLVIHGRDEMDKPVTLFGCSSAGTGCSHGLIRRTISGLVGVRGLEIRSWEEPLVHSVCLDVEHLHRWIDCRALELVQTNDGRPAWTMPIYEDLLLPVSEGIRMRITRNAASSATADKTDFSPECRVHLQFDAPQSLKKITNHWCVWTTRLFSLLIGTSVRCTNIEISPHHPREDIHGYFDSQGVILGRNNSRRRIRLSDPHPSKMLAPFATIQNQFGSVIKSWFTVNEHCGPVVDLFSSVVFNHSIYLQAEFLFLVQALEVYHTSSSRFESFQLSRAEHSSRVEQVTAAAPEDLRGWTRRKLRSQNYKHLNEKVLEVFHAHESEAARLFGDLETMADRLAYTRNHLTHYNNDSDSPRFLNENDMVRTNVALELLLWIILLRELGIQGEPIDRAMRQWASTSFVGLGDRAG